MKILIISSLYPPYHRSGAEVVIDTLVNALKHDHEIHVMTLHPWKGWGSFKFSTETQDGVKVHRFFSLNFFSFMSLGRHSFAVRAIWHLLDIFNLHSYFMTSHLISRIQPDLVLSHNVKGIGYTIFRAIRRSKVKNIHTVHDVQMIEPSGLIMWGKDQILSKPSLIYRINSACTRWLVGSPDTVIFPSRFLKELYERYGFFSASKRHALSNPVPDDFFSVITDNKTLHTPCRFFILGQVVEHKGIRPLIEALTLVPDLACVLTVAGGGSLVEYVKERATKDSRIRYIGFLDRDGVKAELDQTDYTIVPSLCYENSPMSIYESMANGIPVITARIGGVAELVDDEINGYAFTPADVGELSAVLVKAAHNADYSKFSQSARQKVKESAVSGYVKRLLG